jgi:predicted nucleic acid-binding protein
MRYLVDVNVISEPTKLQPDADVVAWLRKNEANLVLDPVVLGEIRLGILLLAAGKRRAALEKWFDQGVEKMVCLSWDAATARQWAALLARLRAKGEAMPLKDSMIAASAATHSLTVATRNVVDFKKAGVRVVNPFSG